MSTPLTDPTAVVNQLVSADFGDRAHLLAQLSADLACTNANLGLIDQASTYATYANSRDRAAGLAIGATPPSIPFLSDFSVDSATGQSVFAGFARTDLQVSGSFIPGIVGSSGALFSTRLSVEELEGVTGNLKDVGLALEFVHTPGSPFGQATCG